MREEWCRTFLCTLIKAFMGSPHPFSWARQILLLASAFTLAIGCSKKDPSDAEMLQRDQARMDRALDGILLDHYKFFKTALRVMPVLDTTIAEHRRMEKIVRKHFPFLLDDGPIERVARTDEPAPWSLADISDFVSTVIELRAFVKAHDEDDFPTFIEGDAIRSGDPVLTFVNGREATLMPPLEGEAKQYLQSIEHTLISAFLFVDRSQYTTRGMMLYECSRSNMAMLPDSEPKAWLQLVRGFLFFDRGLPYLAEKEYSDNLDWLYRVPDVELPITRTIMIWAPMFTGEKYTPTVVLPNDLAYRVQLLQNHLLRAIVRSSMKRKVDEERTLQDFEAIVRVAREAGLDNELVWAVEAYLFLEQGNTDNALRSMQKLRNSPWLGDAERKTIDKSIRYLEKREPGKAMNGLYDRGSMGQLLFQYFLAKAKDQDWRMVLKELGILRNSWFEELIAEITHALEQVDAGSAGDAIMDKGKDLKEKGKALFDDLLN